MRLPYFALLCLLVGDRDVDGSRLSKDTDTIDDASSRRKLSTMDDLLGSLDAASLTIDNKLFMYKTPAFQWVPSSVYRYDDFRAGLEVMAKDGVAGKKYYIGENVENGHIYGLVNIAAFLAQSMKETIQYDACDENSWDLVNGKYPLSNACGQLGQSYQDYHCSEEEAHMECEVDPDMEITAVTHAKWYGAPGPLYCGPKTAELPHSGFWDYNYECNKGWADPPEVCDVYEGQKAGRYDQTAPYANTAGRTDVEGCCWWGRGVIQTTGVCNFGKLNFYLGERAAREGRDARYPSVNFCKDPEVICHSSEHKELKWIAGMFYWMESVQPYNSDGWDYRTELIKFVNGGMVGTSFIDGVSGIVNRGCHNPPCGTGPVDGGQERAENFKNVLDAILDDNRTQVGISSVSNPKPDSQSLSASGFVANPPGSAKWWPDYNPQWTEGKCVNDGTAPSGRPSYDSGEECCLASYGGQSSNSCMDAISSPSQATPNPTNQPTALPTAKQGAPTALPTAKQEAPAFEIVNKPGPSLKPESPEIAAPSNLFTAVDATNLDTEENSSSSSFPASASTPSRQPLDPSFGASGTLLELLKVLESHQDGIDSKLFLHNDPSRGWVKSSVYHFSDFHAGLIAMSTRGVANKRLYIGEENVENGHVYGLVNVAAFIAQSMKETIEYDSCDENNWDYFGNSYPLSNACGQLGQNYQNYHCPVGEEHMECEVDPAMEATAVTNAKWYGAPGPLYCGPKTTEHPHSGFWDQRYQCNKSWITPPETCEVYEGQKAGKYEHSTPVKNAAGREDVEGCCWWGRGVIQTAGVCSFGKLNFWFGERAAREGRDALFPTVNFCKDPEIICSSSEHKELKWIAGFFFWLESIQQYSKDGWSYTNELINFVNNGMSGTSFINSVSGIVNRGCHNAVSLCGMSSNPRCLQNWSNNYYIYKKPCGTGPVEGLWERSQNFKRVLDVLFDGSLPDMLDTNPLVPSNDNNTVYIDAGPLALTDLGRWYPNYANSFSEGKCVNEKVVPFPGGRPIYDNGEDCCHYAYANQASGHCLGSLPNIKTNNKGNPSSALMFADVNVKTRSSLTVHSCGGGEIPPDASVMDILYDYEIQVPSTERIEHILPGLKQELLNDIISSQACTSVVTRNLRAVGHNSHLLGIISTRGSDVIDDEKRTCSTTTSEDCVPVIGYLAAVVVGDSPPEMFATIRQDLIQGIEQSLDSRHVVFVRGHDDVIPLKKPTILSGGDQSTRSNTSMVAGIVAALLIAAIFCAVVLFVKRRYHSNEIQGAQAVETDRTLDKDALSGSDTASNSSGSVKEYSTLDKDALSGSDTASNSSGSVKELPTNEDIFASNGGVNFILLDDPEDDYEIESDDEEETVEA